MRQAVHNNASRCEQLATKVNHIGIVEGLHARKREAMMRTTTDKFSPWVQARAVRLVLDHEKDHSSRSSGAYVDRGEDTPPLFRGAPTRPLESTKRLTTQFVNGEVIFRRSCGGKPPDGLAGGLIGWATSRREASGNMPPETSPASETSKMRTQVARSAHPAPNTHPLELRHYKIITHSTQTNSQPIS